MADLAKFIQRKERNDQNTLERDDGSTTNPGKETMKLLIKTHFPAATELRRYKYDLEGHTPQRNILSKYKEWIDMEKIISAIKCFQSNKSPGTDGFSPAVIKRLPTEFLRFLEAIYWRGFSLLP